ncbi:hypothetical protein [Paenibacillus xylaniclasticus]|uniref:hypothetical protein n=1 Tax=Paenibacillus xylaniclasticus TaxID=588083 RepID=UPI000FDC7809|nr:MULTISPECIES: hypothetical protein [Paenibacillus]GFN33987.1 hypothetical protein PCURB6_42470 [Paenibacillus curdlanolyticus]
MNVRKLIVVCALVSVLSGCGTTSKNQKNEANPTSTDITGTELVSMNDVVITGDQLKDDIYTQISVSSDGQNKTFTWNQVANETYAPKLMIQDINDDGSDEIVIFLTTGTGTAVNVQEAHVLEKQTLTEYVVEKPIDFLEHNSSSMIEKYDDKVQVSLTVQDKRLEKEFDSSFVTMWLDRVGYGSIVNFDVQDGRLVAQVPGAVSPTEFPIVAELQYGTDFKIKEVEIIEN